MQGAKEMQDFSSWTEHLKHPLVLGGFIFMLFAGIVRALIKTKVLRLSKTSSEQIIKKSLLYVFILSIFVVLLGFIIAFIKDGRNDGTGETIIQKTGGEQSPAVITKDTNSPVEITYGSPSKEDKEGRSKIKGSDEVKDNTASPSSHHIEQNTEGNHSPAVVSDGKVNITIENK